MRGIYLIARREFLSYVATWGFWLSLASVPLFMAIGMGLPALIESAKPTRYYVLVDESGGRHEASLEAGLMAAQADQARRMREVVTDMVGESPQVEAALASADLSAGDESYVRIHPDATDLEALRPYLLGEAMLDTPDGAQPLFAAIYLRDHPDNGIEIEYWSANLTDGGLRQQIRRALRDQMREARLIEAGVDAGVIAAADALTPLVRELNPERSGDNAEITDADSVPIYVGIGMAFILWTVVFSVVNMLLTAMIEEKGNKILEMMLASSRHHEILIGKLLGVAAVSATLLLFWGGLSAGFMVGVQMLAEAGNLPFADVMAAAMDPGLLLPAIGYFAMGYLMFGAIFLAIGSLCETLQEAQTLMSPIFLMMMVPLFIVMTAMDSPDSPIVEFASWVPVWTPFIMLARLPLDPPMADIMGTTLVMLGTAAVVIWGSGAVFRMGALNQANQDTVKAWFSFGLGGKKTKSD